MCEKLALITGCSMGIGAEFARFFHENGYKIIGVDKGSLPADLEPNLIDFYQVDLSKLDNIKELAEKVKQKYEKLDVLLNNAGIIIPKLIEEVTEEVYDAHFNINTKAVYFMCQQFLPLLKAVNNGASIINVSSIASNFIIDKGTLYCGTKAAVSHLTRGLALELAKQNIRVNAICPGFTETPLVHGVFEKSTESVIAGMAQNNPMGRLGTPLDLAKIALFLADNEKSPFITGQCLTVDGGLTVKLP